MSICFIWGVRIGVRISLSHLDLRCTSSYRDVCVQCFNWLFDVKLSLEMLLFVTWRMVLYTIFIDTVQVRTVLVSGFHT